MDQSTSEELAFLRADGNYHRSFCVWRIFTGNLTVAFAVVAWITYLAEIISCVGTRESKVNYGNI